MGEVEHVVARALVGSVESMVEVNQVVEELVGRVETVRAIAVVIEETDSLE